MLICTVLCCTALYIQVLFDIFFKKVKESALAQPNSHGEGHNGALRAGGWSGWAGLPGRGATAATDATATVHRLWGAGGEGAVAAAGEVHSAGVGDYAHPDLHTHHHPPSTPYMPSTPSLPYMPPVPPPLAPINPGARVCVGVGGEVFGGGGLGFRWDEP